MKFLPDWFRRDRIERDIEDELAFHVETHARDLVSEGVPPEEARRRALAAFGGMAPIRELTRDVRGGRWLEDLLSDLRYAVRSFRHQPGVAVVAILTLTLGIGANTAIFSMVNGLLLRPLPVREPGRLVLFSDTASEGTRSSTPPPSGRWDLFSTETYEYLRSQSLPLEAIAAFASGEQTVALGLPGQTSQDLRAQAHLVSGNYFDVIGAAPALGRTLTQADDRPSAVPVAVASDSFWRQRLGADHLAIGHTITINGTAFGIVGVMPPEFFGERVRRSPDLWVPLAHQPQVQSRASAAARPELYWLSLFGRLGPSHTIAAAQTATTSALRQFLTASAGAQPSDYDLKRIASVRVQMVSGARGISVTRNQNTELLVLLLSAVGVILLIACSNVGTLLLARAVARQREIAVRRALGASRGRLIRQWLTESVLLAGLGAVGGGIVARFAAPSLFATFVSASNPAKATIDGVVLAFTTGVALVSSLMFGLAPALRAGGVDPLATLRAAGSCPSSRRRAGATDPFVVAQIAMSMALVVGAALLVRTLINLERAPLGFDQDRILLARVNARIAGGVAADAHATDARPEVLDLWNRVYDRIRALPGVESATLARYSPFSGSNSSSSLEIEGYVPAQGERVSAETIAVGPYYPQTMGMPVLAGRAISPQDRLSAPRVVLVNASFARKYFAGGSAVGRRLQIRAGAPHEIIGVVEDARFQGVRDAPPPTVFPALMQDTYLSSTCEIQLRTSVNADVLTETVRRAIAEVDGRIEVGAVRSLRSQVLATFAPERTAAGFLVGFAVLALLVASVGLYGTVSYGLERRTSEIGLRIALGAARRDVVWLVARASVIRLASGLLVGALLARAAGSLVSSQLFGVAPNDALSLLVAAATLSVVVTLATVRPLARAIRIDPMIALRTE
jgi:predicted permease